MPTVSHSSSSVHRLAHVAQSQQAAEFTPDQLAWINDDDSNDLSSYPGPSWDAPRFEPSPEAIAECNGFDRGYSLDHAAKPPGELSSHLALLWSKGHRDGVAQRQADDAERERFHLEMMEWSMRTIESEVDPSEAIHAIGVIEFRKGGVA